MRERLPSASAGLRLRRVRRAAAALAAILTIAGGAWAQDGEAPPAAALLAIEKIVVEPADPAPDTLCRLRVHLANQGEETASQLAFAVTINGVDLGVYGNQVFMYPAEAGATTVVPLYNFWSTETGRPAPADGKLKVEVSLREARWFEIGLEEEVEVWQPIGDVEGLPVSSALTLEMRGAAEANP